MKIDKINKKNIIFFSIAIILAIITYKGFIEIHYSTDMYRIIDMGYKEYILKFSFTDGRIFVALYLFIGDLLNIKPEVYKSIIVIISIIINSISVMKLKNIILKYKQAKNFYIEFIVFLISYCIVFNFMQIELLYYIETASMSMAILLLIFAADIFINKGNKYFLKSSILSILSVICYQAIISLFIALIITLSLIKNKNYKDVIKDVIKSGIIILLSILANILIIRFTTTILNTVQNRIAFDFVTIRNNTIYILNNILWIFTNQANLYVKGMFISLLSILSILALSESCIKKEKHIINILLIIVITIITNFAMHIPTISAYYAGRTKFAVGAILGLMFMYMYIKTEIYEKENLKGNLIVIALITYITTNAIVAMKITTEHKEVNKLEQIEALRIEEYIGNYEKDNSMEIKNIGVLTIYNEREKGYFDEISNKSVMAQNAMKTEWSVDGAINFYTGRKLKKIDLTQDEKIKYISYIEDYDYYKCIGDTLYIKVYNY